MLASSRASDVSNWAKNEPYRVPAFGTPWSKGLSPRFAPLLEICRWARVATRTIGTDTLTDSRSLSPSSALMGVVRRSWRTLSRLCPRFATKPGTPDATRTSCASRATTGMAAAPTVSPVRGSPSGRRAPFTNCASQPTMRGSNVTRSLPCPATSARSTAWAARLTPRASAGIANNEKATRVDLIAKRHPPLGGCRARYPPALARFALRESGGSGRCSGR